MISTNLPSASSTQFAIAGTLLSRLANAEWDRLGDRQCGRDPPD
jgi:hypothetical protein